MKEDDSEPHLSWKRVTLVLLIISIFLVGSVNATMAPVVKQEGKKVKKKVKVISGWFKPSIKGTGYSYRWHYKSWINRCAYCGHHLHMNPKHVPERELTCSHCDADYDGCTGIVKNGKRNKRLKKA